MSDSGEPTIPFRRGVRVRATDFFHQKRSLVLAVSALLVILMAFTFGRRSAGGDPAPEARPGSDETKKKEDERGGVIKFEEASLKLADIRVEPVASRLMQSRLAVNGAVEPNLGAVVKVTTRVAGKIISVMANIGDDVRPGQPLANLASADLGQAQAAYRESVAHVALASDNLQRERKLASLGEFGQHKVQDARTQAIGAQGEINSAQNELVIAQNEISQAVSEREAMEAEAFSAQAEATSGQSEIQEAQGQVESLQAALTQAETQVQVAQSRFNRSDLLLKERLVSRQDWEQAQADLKRAQADVIAARANIGQGLAKVATARAHLQSAQAKYTAARRRMGQAAAKIQTAASRRDQVQARLQTATNQGDVAQQSLGREEKIYQGGYLTSKEIVESEASLQKAQLERQAAANSIRLLGGAPGGGSAVAIVAPIGGRVTERAVSLGESVSPEKPLFTVINLATVWVQFSVYQKDLAAIRQGQAVSVNTDSAPGRTFTGTVSYIGDVADETTRTVKVRCVIRNAGNALKPSTFVRGTIAAGAMLQALAVPRDAIQNYKGKNVVYVEEHPGEFKAKEVTPGETIEGATIVTNGLEAGARVVTKGAFMVKSQAMKSELSEE